MKIVIFLFLFSLGFVIMIYREKIKQFTGTFSFAESWFGAGGTYTFLLIFGLLLSIGSVFWVTGTLDGILNATLGRFFFSH